MRISRFVKGLVSDIDYTLVSNEHCVFPTENIRVVNDGKIYHVSNVKGNDYSFSVTDDFIPVQFCTYQQILFILSYNEKTKEVEIGSIPSFPDAVATIAVNEYAPIKNFKVVSPMGFGNAGGAIPVLVRGPFRTVHTGFGIDHPIDMFAREDYDNTINLYICDGNTPNKVINVGFGLNGYSPKRFYLETELPYKIEQFLNTNLHPKISNYSIVEGGTLPCGNYFIYIRYLTAAFDATHFVTEFGPLQVFVGTDASSGRNIEGSEDRSVSTGKKIVLSISSLDVRYPYYEIGIVRWEGEMFDAISDLYIIDRTYLTTETDISIYGEEKTRIATIADFKNAVPRENVCLAHTQMGNRYWGVNWRERGYDKTYLAELAKKIIPKWITKPINDVTKQQYEYPNTAASGIGQHKDYRVTMEGRSFYRGEIYPFAVVFVIGGVETEAFPIMGIDYLTWYPNGSNDKGLVRMPGYRQDRAGDDGPNDLTKALGVEFDNSFINQAINDNQMFARICDGYYIVIGDRQKNILTTGIMVSAYNKVTPNSLLSPIYFGENSDGLLAEDNSVFMPLFYERLPHKLYNVMEDRIDIYSGYSVGTTRKNKAGIFSPDILFNLNAVFDGKNNVRINGTFTSLNVTTNVYHFPSEYSKEATQLDVFPVLTKSSSLVVVEPMTFIGKDRFGSYFSDGVMRTNSYAWKRDETGFIRGNRSIKLPRYIGCTFDDYDVVQDQWSYVSVLRHSSDAEYYDSAQNSFNPSTSIYKRITSLLEFNQDKKECYSGDCFLQRSFIRVHRWDEKQECETGLDHAGSFYHPHGMMISFISENAVNVAMRNNVSYGSETVTGEYTYFPKCLSGFNVIQWVQTSEAVNAAQEAFDICPGYNKVYGMKDHIGYDKLEPDYITAKKTRIRHTAAHVPYSFIDGYRMMLQSEYVDYDISKGEMVAVYAVSGSLVTIQEHAINQHYSEQKQLEIPTSEGEILLGTGSILSSQVKVLGEFGSSSLYMTAETQSGIYGIDLLRGKLWRIGAEQSQYGSTYLMAALLSDQQGFSYGLKDIISESKLVSDIGVSGKNPYKLKGVRLGYDKEYGEVLVSFINNDYRKTLVYSEKLNALISIYTFAPIFWANTEISLFSINGNKKVYKHNTREDSVFYEEKHYPKISFVVNDVGAEAFAETKIYESLMLEMNYVEPLALHYQTNFHAATHIPFINKDRFWATPKYQHDKWLVPIMVKQDGTIAQAQIGSELRGRWMKVTIDFNSSYFYINNVTTKMTEGMLL